MHILLPTTDAGVIAQVVVVTLLFSGILWLARHRPDARLLVIGLWLTTYGAMGLRALH